MTSPIDQCPGKTNDAGWASSNAPTTEHYGPLEDQVGDLHLPAIPRPRVVCLLHGGFWRMPHGRDQMDAIARDLATRGFAVWNIGYRRLGTPTGGWPGSFDDVLAGIDHLARLVAGGIDLDLAHVAVVGHSAGGHLALWAAARDRDRATHGAATQVRITAAAGLAPVADLVRAHALGVGGSAVAELLDGTPTEQEACYREASPAVMLPLGVPQLLIHATDDDIVPVGISRAYAQAASAAGDRIELIELPGSGHMDFLDPASAAHAVLCEWLARMPGAGSPPILVRE